MKNTVYTVFLAVLSWVEEKASEMRNKETTCSVPFISQITNERQGLDEGLNFER